MRKGLLLWHTTLDFIMVSTASQGSPSTHTHAQATKGGFFSKKGAQAPAKRSGTPYGAELRNTSKRRKGRKKSRWGAICTGFVFSSLVSLVVRWGSHGLGFLVYKMPESARALCRMVSLTAAKTRRMLDVSVACVRLEGVSFCCDVSLGKCLGFEIHTYWGYKFRCARLTWLKRHSRYLAARLTSLPPE